MKSNTMLRGILLISCIILFMLTIYLLTSGSLWLETRPFDFWPIPNGNLITWFGLMAWLALPLLWSPGSLRNNRSYRLIHVLLLALASLWPLITFFFAGNWSMSFGTSDGFRGSPLAGEYAYIFTALLALYPLLNALGLFFRFLLVNMTRSH